MTNEQYYELIKPYEDASRVLSTRLEILNHSLYGDRSAAGPKIGRASCRERV